MALKRGQRGLLLLFMVVAILVVFCVFVLAQQSQELTKIKKSYTWLQGRAIEKWQNLNAPQHTFSLLALGTKLTQSQLDSSTRALLQKSYGNGTCWPGPSEASCNSLDTALSKITLDASGKVSSKANEWLLNHTTTPSISGVSWLLQLTQPSGNDVRCFLSYEEQGAMRDYIVSFDKKGIVGGEFGSCFSNATYWLQLMPQCADKTFTVSCNDTILANFLLKKGAEWFVTSKTERASPLGNLSIKLVSLCIGQAGSCNYEATLWTAYAFSFSGQQDIARAFLPYLIMNAEATENQRYLPEAFLYKLTQQQSYATKLAQAQKQDGLWLAQGSSNRYYDTALVTLMTQRTVGNVTKAKETLLREQKADGSWECTGCNNIRDTALLLLGLWPDYEWRSPCEIEGYSCVSNCSAAGGTSVSADCFTGECCNISFSCEQKYGQCKAACLGNETQVPYTCSSGVCCKEFSKALCVSEIKGILCGLGQQCLNSQGLIIPFITSGDPSPYCCKGTCSTGALTCEEANGTYCDINLGYSCLQDRWVQPNCCQLGYCTEAPQTCQQKGGEICLSDQDCKRGILVEASNTQGLATCCVQGGTCIQKTCSHNICEKGESCVGGASYETSDALICCEGQCLESCSSMQGTLCNASMTCKGTTRRAADVSNCCIGKCVKKGAFPWWIIIVIAIVAVIIVLFYLIKTGKIKLKGKPKTMQPTIEYGFGMPPRGLAPRGFPPRTLPTRGPPPRQPIQPRPQPQPLPTKPIAKPQMQQKPIAKPISPTMKPIQKPVVKPAIKPTAKPIVKKKLPSKLPQAPKAPQP